MSYHYSFFFFVSQEYKEKVNWAFSENVNKSKQYYLATFVSHCVLTYRDCEMDVEEGKMNYANNAYNY